MIRYATYIILALAALGMSGLQAQAEETNTGTPTEQSLPTKKEKIKERRAARKQKRAEKLLKRQEAKPAPAAPTALQPAAADEPQSRPRSATPIVIVPPKPPTPAPVFSES